LERKMWKLEYEALKLYHHLCNKHSTLRTERIRQKARQRWQRRIRSAFGCVAQRLDNRTAIAPSQTS